MTQTQREALFDLLTLCIYADHHISLTEEALLESAFIAEGWESEYPKNLFLEKSFARAREAADSDEGLKAYLVERAAAFDDEASQTEAYGVVQNIVRRDGLAAEDAMFLNLLKEALPKLG
jgi:hypothetical protein